VRFGGRGKGATATAAMTAIDDGDNGLTLVMRGHVGRRKNRGR
jgi:hypothetical protein